MAAYHQLWQIEKSFRMSKTNLRARPIYHHKRESIEAHLTIVFAALAVSRWLERTTGWSTKKLLTTLRRYHTSTSKPETRPSPPPTPTRRHSCRPRQHP
jgi:transposase